MQNFCVRCQQSIKEMKYSLEHDSYIIDQAFSVKSNARSIIGTNVKQFSQKDHVKIDFFIG